MSAKNEQIEVSAGTTLTPAPFARAAQFAVAILQLKAEHGGKDTLPLVSVTRSKDGKRTLGVRPTDFGRYIAGKVQAPITPQLIAGMVLVSRGFLTLTPNKLGVMTARAADARKAESQQAAVMARDYGRQVSDVITGIDDSAVEQIAGGVTFA